MSLYFRLQDVNSGPVEIALVGPDGYRNTVFRFGKDFKAGRASVNPKDLPLVKGEYEVRFSFPPTPGRVSIFVKT